jgi:hypothetical protein
VAYSIPVEQVIPYGPEALRTFYVYGVEWIDDLHFLVHPQEFVGDRTPAYLAVARERFLEAGWAGDGEVALLWLPAFVFPLSPPIPWEGVVLWHVKQEEDGLSFLLSPRPLLFEEFRGA